jgi:ribose transport system permease protein
LDFGLDTITVVVLGGVSVFGGKGSILKVFIAALLLSVITNGMVIIGLSAYVQLMVKGLILMIAVSLDVYGSGRARR